MSACNAELCPNWTGQGCICDVMDIAREDPDECIVCEYCGDERP